jgi:penicillin amidase
LGKLLNFVQFAQRRASQTTQRCASNHRRLIVSSSWRRRYAVAVAEVGVMRSKAIVISAAVACVAGLGACAPGHDDGPPPPRLEIIIDQNGVPHIYGATDEDAFFGAGYQMASDRLFHMDQARRRAQGRLAEIHGQEAVEDDEIARLFDWAGWGARHAEKMRAENAETVALVQAWVDGVNARLDEVRRQEAPTPWGFGPDEFGYMPDDWTVEHVMTIATMTGFGNDLSFDREAFAAIAFKLFPDAVGAVELFKPAREAYTTDGPAGLEADDAPPSTVRLGTDARRPPVDVSARDLARTLETLKRLRRLRGIGSNNWAVHGRHTASGRPLIAGDPHLGFDLPGLFYALHINSKDQDGTIDAAGFSFVGTPGISVGQTDRVVWTPTTAFADVMDVWTVAMPDPDHVEIAGQLVEVTRREELITVRNPGAPAGEGNTRALEVLTVDGYGVILPTDLVPIPLGEDGDRLLMNWIGFAPNAFPSLLDFNRVTNIDEYDVAVDGFAGNFNFVAADAEGITHRVGTRVPVRDVGEGRTPWLVLDADDPDTLWTGEFLPPEQLPHGRGEARGFVATANNDPFGFTANGRVDDDPWYFGAFFAPGWRAGRIEAELGRLIDTSSGSITLEDMQALQQDVHSSLADDLVPLVEQAWANVGTDPALAEFEGRTDVGALVQLLAQWDRQMRRDSAAAVVLHAFAQMATRRTLEDDLSLLFLQAMDLQPVFIIKIATLALRGAYPQGDVVMQEGRDFIVLAALADTADLLTERFGGVDPQLYRLADARVTSFDGATGRGLDRGTYPTDGSESTVNVAADGSFFDTAGGVHEQWVSHWGPIFRHVATFAEDGTPELYFTAPLGNVADPSSPHFEDLHDGWVEGEYRKMPYRRDDVEASAEDRFTLLESDPAGD